MNVLYALDFLTWMLLLISLASVTSMLLLLGKTKVQAYFLLFLFTLNNKWMFYPFVFQALKLSNLVFMPYGILFAENHFRDFRQRSKGATSGLIIRYFWLFSVLVLTMAYQGNLKVSWG